MISFFCEHCGTMYYNHESLWCDKCDRLPFRSDFIRVDVDGDIR